MLFGGVYAALLQHKGYGDGPYLILSMRVGQQWPSHQLFLPLLRAWCELLAPLEPDLSQYEAGVLLCGLGAATGVALFFVASVALGARRWFACTIAVLIGTSPAVVFFATVLEIHAVFLAFAGGAAVVLAAFRRRATVVRALVQGPTTPQA
ncbi:MAG: hypothetical protein AAF628_37390 [Planctomycetota bacterium]